MLPSLYSFAGLPKTGLLLWFVERLKSAGSGCSCGFASLLLGARHVVAGEELERKFAVSLGSAGFGVIEGDGFAVTRRLCKANVAGNAGLEELVVEEPLTIF